jgi:polysaccharide pyruvyl transferase CsaB
MTLRVLIAGYYGAGNAGDEEILHSLMVAMRRRDPSADFRVLSYDPSRTAREHAVTTLRWDDLEGQVDAVGWASLVVVGGGGLFQDYWGFDRSTFLSGHGDGISAYGGPILLARVLGVPSAVLGVGVGPLDSPEARLAVRELVELATFVSVRDRASIALLTECGVDPGRIHAGGDLALLGLLRPAGQERHTVVRGTRPLLGVALRHWTIGLDQGLWEREVAFALDAYVEATGGELLFVPFQDGTDELHDDRRVASSVRSRMKRGATARILSDGPSYLGRSDALGSCDLVLGMRLHSLVAATRECVPAVALAYDPKIEAFMVDGGMGEFCLPLRGIQADVLSARLASALDSTVRLRLKSKLARDTMNMRAEESVDKALLLAGERKSFVGRGLLGEALGTYSRQIQEARAQLRANQAELEGVRKQRDYLAADRNRMEYDYASLRGSFGVKLIRRYWRLLGRLAPEGSRRRVAYRVFHPFLRGGLKLLSRPLGLDRVREAGQDNEATWESFTAGQPSGPEHSVLDARLALMQFGARAASRHPAIASVVLFSATQLIESEGQRPTNLALEFAKVGIPVVFCNWRWDKTPWTVQDRIADGILQFPMDLAVDGPSELFRRSFGKPGVVIFEFPHPDLFHVAATAHASGWVTIYDVIDDWDGFHDVRQAAWYEQGFEQHLLVTSDLVLGVNDTIVRRIRGLGRANVDLVPNGLPSGIGRVRLPRVLPQGELTVGYFGHLTSSWFDWDLVLGAAKARPEWVWHIIGYGADREVTNLPPNMILMGKVKQEDLASYAANWDVGVIPFKKGRLASGADAIKLYEYMAMGLPVVAVGAPVPATAAGLALEASNCIELILRIEAAASTKESLKEARLSFAAKSSWRSRSDQILGLIESRAQRIGEKLSLFGGES